MRPLAIDLFCGLGGWADGLLAEGYYVVGFDVERHRYPARDFGTEDGSLRKVKRNGVDFNSTSKDSRDRSFNYANQCAVRDAPLTGGWMEYPGQLVLQDVLTLHGSQFKDAALIVASPPCQAYSYRAMPWKRAKALPPPDNTLFEACFRIQREACEAAGRHIPLIVENVRGAQKWVGRAKWNYGSFYLWGDVPALMPITLSKRMKYDSDCGPRMWRDREVARLNDTRKNTGGSWFNVAHNTTSGKGQNPDGRKVPTVGTGRRTAPGNGERFTTRDCGTKNGADWFGAGDDCSLQRSFASKSPKRKMASALIAKIPFELARHIGATFRPQNRSEAA